MSTKGVFLVLLATVAITGLATRWALAQGAAVLGNTIPTAQPASAITYGAKLCIVVHGGRARDTVPVPNSWTPQDCQRYREKSAPDGVYILGCMGPQAIAESAANATSFRPCW
jgi:hypothetical protein